MYKNKYISQEDEQYITRATDVTDSIICCNVT